MIKWAHKIKSDPEYSITSPNGRIKCFFLIKKGRPHYQVFVDEYPLIRQSAIGLKIFGEPSFDHRMSVVQEIHHTHKETIEMQWGEDHFIENSYHETSFRIQDDRDQRELIVRFRVFNNAVAFRYEFPKSVNKKRIVIEDELTEFNLDLNSDIWHIPALQPNRYEYNYEKSMLHSLTNQAHTPLTARTQNGKYLSIHEAALYNYGAMNLKLTSKGALKASITPRSDRSLAHLDLPAKTPWRLIMIADSAIGLTTNRVMYALNDPPQSDFSWVNTIKFIGIWWAMYVGEWTWAPGERHGATTKHAMEYIDAAVRLGIRGLLIEGWNEGWEGDWLENGANNSFTSATPDFDLEKVAAYARNKHIELIGHHETVGYVSNYEKQLEAAYNLYAANGIHYIKTGYANNMMTIGGRKEYHHSQLGVNHYQKTVELAARKHICLDIHEPIKGTGIERTWPNLLSREGARGQEYEGGSISPTHACILPYTRLLSGGMDYTSGIFDLQNKTKPIHTTLARQLAYFVVIYSGMQMAADRPHIYEQKFSELFSFIRDVPVNYEKTIPLAGEIGEYYVVARKDRNSEEWYIGGITNHTARKIHIDFSFLEYEKYHAKIYQDSHDAHYLNNPFGMQIVEQNIQNNSSMTIRLAPGGGFAIRLQRL